MGIKERKQRHKDDLRQLILDAAKLLFLKKGYEATSIRKIAAAIEFSPATIYLYYKDKSDIIFALHLEGFKLLLSKFETLATVEDPFERLKAMGRIYLQFSQENSEFYELMFVMKDPIAFLENKCVGADEQAWIQGQNAFDYVVQTIAACQKKNYFTQHDTKIFATLVWATVHGLCTLYMHGHLTQVINKEAIALPEGTHILDAAFTEFVQILEALKD